jgi:hypothetical protein
MSKEVFIKMREEEFNEIPNEIKERYFNSRNVTREVNDWDVNMEDEAYKRIYTDVKKLKKQLEEREYQLRETRRNNTNKI